MLLKPVSFLKKAAAGSFVPTDLASGLEVWIDMQDATSFWTDSVGGTQAGNGDTVAWISDKSGNANHAEVTGGSPIFRTGPNRLEIPQTCKIRIQGVTLTSDMDCYFVIDKASSATFWSILGKNSNSIYIGLQDGDTASASVSNMGSPTIRAAGVDISPINRDTLNDNLGTGSKISGSVIGFDGTNSVPTNIEILMFAYNNGGFALNGDGYQFVITAGLSTGDQALMENWAAAQ